MRRCQRCGESYGEKDGLYPLCPVTPGEADADVSPRVDGGARPSGRARAVLVGTVGLLLGVWICLGLAPPAGGAEPPEAGYLFEKAVKEARADRYKEAMGLLDQAKKAHAERSRRFQEKRLNPDSDPDEQIFPRCCDQLKAYWAIRGALKDGGKDKLPRLGTDSAAHAKVIDDVLKEAEGGKKVAAAVAQVQAALKTAGVDDKDPAKGVQELATALADQRVRAEDNNKAVAAPLKGAGIDEKAPARGVAALAKALKDAPGAAALAEMGKALNKAGVKAKDPAEGITAL